MTRDKDWDAIVVVTAPIIGLLHRIATGENDTGFPDFVKRVFAQLRRIDSFLGRSSVSDEAVSLVQPHEAVSAGVAGLIMGGPRSTCQATSACREPNLTSSEPYSPELLILITRRDGAW